MSNDGKQLYRERFGRYELTGIDSANEPGKMVVTLQCGADILWVETVEKSMRFRGATEIVNYVDELVEQRLREASEPREWLAQYQCEPREPLPEGTYCALCSHDDEPYLSDRCGRRECREEHPSCPHDDCPCIAHMERRFTVSG